MSNMTFESTPELKNILNTIERIAVSQGEVAYWLKSIETTARHMCNKSENIVLEYDKGKNIKFFIKDDKSLDCLVKAIEILLPSIPEMLQGFFTVFKYNLKNLKSDTSEGK